MAKNTGLGKGLEALFGDTTIVEDIKKEEKKEGEVIEKIKIMALYNQLLLLKEKDTMKLLLGKEDGELLKKQV